MKNHSNTFAHRMQNERSILTLEILSDLHITLPKHNKVLDNALDDIWRRKVKTIAIAGDLCSHGLMFQLQQCLKQLKEYPFQYLIALGNHDTYSMKEKEQIHIHPLYKELVLQNHHQLYYDEWIYGIHFYVLNSEKPCKSQAYLSRQQLFWLKEKLLTDPKEKPVFVLCHHPLQDTHPNSDTKELAIGSQSQDLYKILCTHPNIIYVSGHIHNSYETCMPRVDGHIIEIDVPSFAQTMFGSKKEEIGLQLQIYHDFLYLKTRNYKQHDWIISHEYIIDLSTHEIHSFDVDIAKQGESKKK